jgi:hypothetical protein
MDPQGPPLPLFGGHIEYGLKRVAVVVIELIHAALYIYALAAAVHRSLVIRDEERSVFLEY